MEGAEAFSPFLLLDYAGPLGDGTARVIAGEFGEGIGPAHTRASMSVPDLRLDAGRRIDLALTEGWTAVVIVLVGAYGPFVMNTTEEIRTALTDYREGRFGQIQETTDAPR